MFIYLQGRLISCTRQRWIYMKKGILVEQMKLWQSRKGGTRNRPTMPRNKDAHQGVGVLVIKSNVGLGKWKCRTLSHWHWPPPFKSQCHVDNFHQTFEEVHSQRSWCHLRGKRSVFKVCIPKATLNYYHHFILSTFYTWWCLNPKGLLRGTPYQQFVTPTVGFGYTCGYVKSNITKIHRIYANTCIYKI